MTELTVEKCGEIISHCAGEGTIGFTLRDDYNYWTDVVLNYASVFELYAAIGKMADAETDLTFLTLCDIENVSGDEDFLELVGHGEFAILRITTQSYGDTKELSLKVSLPALLGYIEAAVYECE
tara:strand:+ start:904 stop:1275 length:372 start_codon:yes stop_codon:yes gene_type:complete